MEKKQLNFSTNAKLEKLIGRELITNNIIAIFELIKNAYDAFAHQAVITFEGFDISYEEMQRGHQSDKVISGDRSKIFIKDDGIGMSYEDVRTKWMEIGTTNKENTMLEVSGQESDDRRIINGEKGIGRFGTDKLGAMLRLTCIGDSGYEKTVLDIDWNRFDDHSITIQDVVFECSIEKYQKPQKTGVTLEISSLRDIWTKGDIIKLRRQLGKLISPFSQEKDKFQIYINYNNQGVERIVNDSFEYVSTGIEAGLNVHGALDYTIFTPLEKVSKSIQLPSPGFGPAQLKILYMDKPAKIMFMKRTGTASRDYGNVKVFRDNFRVLPYGEKENDWLGIDNKHAQGTFRTFGTRDLIGYVQIGKAENPKLKDATSRQGLNEDVPEFEEFKEFIWRCIELLQTYVFRQIKQEAEKQGEVIRGKVNEIQQDITDFKKEIPLLYEDIEIPEEDRKKLVDRTTETLETIHQNIQYVEQANRQLSNRVKVMEKIVGAENRLYDMLHAVKNRLAALEAVVTNIETEAARCGIVYDRSFADKTLKDIEKMILSAMRRSSPKRAKRDTIILSQFIEEFIDDSKKIYQDIEFEFTVHEYSRIFVNVEELRVSLENLLDNSIKAMQKQTEKRIYIYIIKEEKHLKLYFEDNGKGIAKEEAPFIFNVSFTTTNGSGIGLSNVLDFMKSEGGDINLLEEGRMKGAAFELIFPLRGGVS